jgi:predicted nicotinamide N-methyase
MPLLSLPALASAKVLELGAGTGVLASLIAPLAGAYTATDRQVNLKLVQRNVDNNAAAAVKVATKALGGERLPATTAELDWEQVSVARAHAQAKGETYALPAGSPGADADLVLGVDCIYNEHLVQPLVDTLAAACARGAVAWVVVEKRSPEVVSDAVPDRSSPYPNTRARGC